jgi:hypothetical protein
MRRRARTARAAACGTAGLFVILAAVMFLTRNLD